MTYVDLPLPGMPEPPPPVPVVPVKNEAFKISGDYSLRYHFEANLYDAIMAFQDEFKRTVPDGYTVDKPGYFEEKVNKFFAECLDNACEVMQIDMPGIEWDRFDYPEYDYGWPISVMGELEAALVQAGVYDAEDERARANGR